MPSFCVVPQCSSRTTGHRFPSDLERRKMWLMKIRRDKFKPTPYSRICKKHFLKADYVMPLDSVSDNPIPRLKKTAVPSQFAWSKLETESSMKRAERANRRLHIMNVIPTDASKNIGSVEDILQPEVFSGTEISVNEVVVECSKKNVSTQCETSVIVKCDKSTNTISDNNTHALNILSFQNIARRAELQFYTGFDSYDHFQFVFSTLGPAANNLMYFHSGSTKKIYTHLLPVNEFFLTIMKLRCNVSNTELAFRFMISETLVSIVFITWINFLFCQFKKLQFWVPLSVAEQNKKVKGQKCSSTVIIDCTEIKIEQSKNPVPLQQTYSSYKSSNTVQVLIGLSSVGTVTFVSDAYGGAISDQALFEKCGISDLLTKSDIVLADKGFQIQDLAPKDVKVNMPEFLKNKTSQLEPEQLDRSKKTSSNRIHVQRVIGLGKTYRILKGTLSSNLVPIASRIIFVCFMLVNFRQNIMEEKEVCQ